MELKNFDFKQKLLHHPEQLLALRQGKRPFPVTMEIDLTNLCNHNCYFCVVKQLREQHRVSLDTQVALKAIHELKQLGVKGISFTGGGEPLVHKDFYKILDETHELGIDIGLMTNGALIDDGRMEQLLDALTWIRISVGAGNPSLYHKIQGRDDFRQVIRTIHTLGGLRAERGKGANIGVRMLLDDENYHSLRDLCTELEGSGIDYVQVAPDCRDQNYAIFSADDFRAVIAEAKRVLEQSGISLLLAGFTQNQDQRAYPQKCYAHYFQMALTATGNLVFCKNVRAHDDMAIGNIYQQSIGEIWNGPVNRDIEDRVCPETCDEICKNMQINVAIEQFLNPTGDMSVNFIG